MLSPISFRQGFATVLYLFLQLGSIGWHSYHVVQDRASATHYWLALKNIVHRSQESRRRPIFFFVQHGQHPCLALQVLLLVVRKRRPSRLILSPVSDLASTHILRCSAKKDHHSYFTSTSLSKLTVTEIISDADAL